MKKNLKKTLCWILAVCATVTILGGCNSGSGGSQNPTENHNPIPDGNTPVMDVTEKPVDLTEATAEATEATVEATEATEMTEATEETTPATTPPQTEPPATEPKATEPPATEPPATQPRETEPPHTHSYTSNKVAATCEKKGYTEYKCSCGHSYKDSYTDALGHSYSDSKVDATCDSKGYTLHKCSKCGDSYKDGYTDALGHSYTSSVVAPTYDAGGYTLYTCSKCGHSYKDNYTDKLEGEVIDVAALEAYGRKYASDTYGYEGDPKAGFNTNAGYGPPLEYFIRTMEEGRRIIREGIDYEYACHTAAGYKIVEERNGVIYRLNINVYLKPTGTPNEYLIYIFYGGNS